MINQSLEFHEIIIIGITLAYNLIYDFLEKKAGALWLESDTVSYLYLLKDEVLDIVNVKYSTGPWTIITDKTTYSYKDLIVGAGLYQDKQFFEGYLPSSSRNFTDKLLKDKKYIAVIGTRESANHFRSIGTEDHLIIGTFHKIVCQRLLFP